MNLIYVGSARPESMNDELIKMGSYINFAGNTLQNALLEGFEQHCPDLKIVTNWTISPFPKVKKLVIPKKVMSYGKNEGNYVYTGILNLPGINLFSRFLRTRKQIKKMLSKTEDNAVVIYEVHTPFLLAAVSLRKRLKSTCLIVPDLPEYMHGSKNVLRRMAKALDKKLIDYCVRRIDSFALLSQYMQERLPMEGKPWVLMEGIFQGKRPTDTIQKEKYKTIMFAGNLGTFKGIKTIADAFAMIDDPDYRLWVRGDGEFKEELLRRAETDKRIVWYPPLSRKELLDLERKATVMVNGAEPDFDAARYFFPSKTMEYMASGAPTVMFHLACMPEEYGKHIFYVDGEGAKGLRDKLVEVCEKPTEELIDFGQRAADFIFTEKTPYLQCGKIINLLKSL